MRGLQHIQLWRWPNKYTQCATNSSVHSPLQSILGIKEYDGEIAWDVEAHTIWSVGFILCIYAIG